MITPGKRSPSIVSLEESNWVAVNALVLKKEVSLQMCSRRGKPSLVYRG